MYVCILDVRVYLAVFVTTAIASTDPTNIEPYMRHSAL